MTVRHIGGDAAHRSFFGGTRDKLRMILTVVTALGTGLAIILGAGPVALAVGVVVYLIVVVLTIQTHRDSVLDRRIRKARWRSMVKHGTDKFVPYTEQTWEAAKAEAAALKDKRAAARVLNAVRERPDGADGMGWLDSRARKPGIAWHHPIGEEEEGYLSVAFVVDGQLRGNESTQVQEEAQSAIGKLRATYSSSESLVRGMQIMTRVLPPDMALNEQWVAERMSADANEQAVHSYQENLRLIEGENFVQRHVVVAKWPLSADFKDQASQWGQGRSGWRRLMEHEIESFKLALREAKFKSVEVLTARAVVAMILHQQNPSRPPLMVADVDVRHMGLPSWNQWSSWHVLGTDPRTEEEVTWLHRTARFTSDDLETGGRSPYWLMGLLLQSGVGVRTVSIQYEGIPAEEARTQASRDVVRDSSDVVAKKQKGKIVDGAAKTNLRASQARAADLEPGTGQHGGNWVAYVSVSAQSQLALTRACRRLVEGAKNRCGIRRLHWLDTQQSAAAGNTWPIMRGLKPETKSAGSKAMDMLAGRREKEEKVA